MRCAVLLFTFCLAAVGCYGQDPAALMQPGIGPVRPDSILVRQLILVGNRRTRPHIIIRELGFAEGTRLAVADTALLLRQARNRVFNTRLFVTTQIVCLAAGPDSGRAPRPLVVLVQLRERWYIFPIPILELADRSINEWIYNHGADLHRINAGMRVDAANLRGRNETLRLVGQLGFTRKLEASYSFPYLSKRLQEGLSLSVQHLANRQVAARSVGNRQDFFQTSVTTLYTRWRAGAEFSWRPAFYQTHSAGAGWAFYKIADSLAAYNPAYLGDGRTTQRHFYARYGYTWDRRDVRQYPLHGHYIGAGVERLGLLQTDQVNIWSASAEVGKFWEITPRLYSGSGLVGCVSTPARQPYNQTRGLGFGQTFVRGYEKYVIEGPRYAVAKQTLRFRAFSTVKEMPYMPLAQFRVIPIALYPKVYVDAGYVANPYIPAANARLANTLLLGYGAGLDLVTYYDYVLRLEYSFNRQGGSGLFIHLAAEI